MPVQVVGVPGDQLARALCRRVRRQRPAAGVVLLEGRRAVRPVHRGGGGEHHPPDARAPGGLEQAQGPHDVDVVEPLWLAQRGPHPGQRRQVHHHVDRTGRGEGPIQVARAPGCPPRPARTPARPRRPSRLASLIGPGIERVEVVEPHHPVAPPGEPLGQVRSDEAALPVTRTTMPRGYVGWPNGQKRFRRGASSVPADSARARYVPWKGDVLPISPVRFVPGCVTRRLNTPGIRPPRACQEGRCLADICETFACSRGLAARGQSRTEPKWAQPCARMRGATTANTGRI